MEPHEPWRPRPLPSANSYLLIKPIESVLSATRTSRLTVMPHQSLFRLSFARFRAQMAFLARTMQSITCLR
jgi:hypothetical protein